MLLRSSSIHTRRLRRLALTLISLGLLILAAVIAISYWRQVQATRAREDYLQRIFFNPPGSEKIDPPFLVANGAQFTYGPGQTAVAFAEGFQPHEPVFVRLYSRTRGLLRAYQAIADLRGQLLAASPLSTVDDSQEYTPPGGLWFEMEALSGREQVFRFRLDTGKIMETAASKGVYPPRAVPGTILAFWCSGFQPTELVTVEVLVDGQELSPEQFKTQTYPTTTDGLLLGMLAISPNSPAGEWQLHANHCQLTFPVHSTYAPTSIDEGVLDVYHAP